MQTLKRGDVRELPAPIAPDMKLIAAVGQRRSVREFSDQKVDASILAHVLWCTCGTSSAEGKLTVPTTMDRREMTAYVLDSEGVWRYDPVKNALVCTHAGDARADSTTDQDFVKTAPVTLVIAADNKKAAGIEDYVKYDAGFCGMAAQLACVAVGLGSVVRGSFDAEKLTRALGEDATPLLCVTLGFAA
ncbi:nitroreductase family protein [uncultured Duodenibacillus sp.]|uniref:nitroreductase family protein n=1 Tax=uncultured Duodenibacillus sp. TaxID=1980699 RepID=UPI002599CDB2|nr:nitroreductase family protein [uncultured Duodenibacillus sp.]